jgi:hypothetical protein
VELDSEDEKQLRGNGNVLARDLVTDFLTWVTKEGGKIVKAMLHKEAKIVISVELSEH